MKEIYECYQQKYDRSGHADKKKHTSLYLTLALRISCEVSLQTTPCSCHNIISFLSPHTQLVRLLLVVHNTMYSPTIQMQNIFLSKPRILLMCSEKQGLHFVSAFVLVSLKSTYDQKLKAYIAGKIFLFKIIEFQKQHHLKLFRAQTETRACVYFHHFRMLQDVSYGSHPGRKKSEGKTEQCYCIRRKKSD